MFTLSSVCQCLVSWRRHWHDIDTGMMHCEWITMKTTTLMRACVCERAACRFLHFISVSLNKLFFSVNSYSTQTQTHSTHSTQDKQTQDTDTQHTDTQHTVPVHSTETQDKRHRHTVHRTHSTQDTCNTAQSSDSMCPVWVGFYVHRAPVSFIRTAWEINCEHDFSLPCHCTLYMCP